MTLCWFAQASAAGVSVTDTESSWLARMIGKVPGVMTP
jgi:hypothetical protein